MIDSQGGGRKALGSAVQGLRAYNHVQPVREAKPTHTNRYKMHMHRDAYKITKHPCYTDMNMRVQAHTHTHTQMLIKSVTVWRHISTSKLSEASPCLPGLQALDATQHVQVAGGVLFDHILHVVRTQSLLELLLGYMELHDPAEGQTAEIQTSAAGGALVQPVLTTLQPADSDK